MGQVGQCLELEARLVGAARGGGGERGHGVGAPRDARQPGVVQAQHADPENDPTTIVQGYLAGHEPPFSAI